MIFYHHAGDNDDVIIGQDYTLPDHPSEIYSQQIVDPNVISLQEEGDIFSPQEPPDTDSLQVLRSASFTSTSSASSSFMRLPSFSVPLTAAEKEKKKSSLQFTAPKQYSTPPTSTLSKSQSTLSDEKTESSQQHHLSSRQSSIVSRSSSSSSPSSSPSVQSNKSIKNAPKSLLSQSQSARNENTGSLVEQRRESQRPAPQISLLFERDIFADDYSSHSIPDTRDIELTSLPIDIDERTASSTSLGELILPELQVSLMNDEVETTSIDPDVQRTVSRFLSRANSGVSSTNRPTLSHQSVDTVSSTNSIIDKI